MSTMTANAHRAPLPLLTAGQRFALQSAAIIGGLFMVAFSYGLAERNMLADLVHVIVFAWNLATNPWAYCVTAGLVIVWKNRKLLDVKHQAAAQRRPHAHRAADSGGGRHRAARRG